MKVYAFVDKRYPNLDLVIVTTEDPELLLERVEVDVQEDEDVIAAVKEKLGLTEGEE
jgi:hypothetical protein